MALRPLERLVEVQSENLREVLRGCLKHIDTVFDLKPMVELFDYGADDRLMRRSCIIMKIS
jgi:hypothetical protein